MDWTDLRAAIARHGLRNSLLTAPMPTASAAQIAGNTESFEPPTSNVFVRRVLSEFVVVNRRLVAALQDHAVGRRAPATAGAARVAAGAPRRRRPEGDLSHGLGDPAEARAADGRRPRAFIDQSQSMNIFMANASAQADGHAHVRRRRGSDRDVLPARAPRSRRSCLRPVPTAT